MKIKLAIIFGIVIWFLTLVLTSIFNPIFTDNLPNINIVVPIIIIIVTGFFGILYIRNIEKNEVIEGFLVGVVFILMDVICDYVFLILPQYKTLMIQNYPLHLFSMIVLTLLITTFLGYLAQMKIDLK